MKVDAMCDSVAASVLEALALQLGELSLTTLVHMLTALIFPK